MAETNVTVIPIHGSHSMSSGACLPAEVCLVGNPSSIFFAVPPNMTLLGFDVLVTGPSDSEYEAEWDLPCLEPSCPGLSLGSGRGSLPLEIHVDGLSLSNVYLRLDLNNTNAVEEKPNPLAFVEVGIGGTGRIIWGPPLVPVVRELPFSFTTTPCLDGPICNPPSADHAELDLVGIATHVEIHAEWTAASPFEEELRFYVICEVACKQEYSSGDVTSPANMQGSVRLQGPRIWIGATVTYAGLVGGAFGAGTEIQGTLRLTELVVA